MKKLLYEALRQQQRAPTTTLAGYDLLTGDFKPNVQWNKDQMLLLLKHYAKEIELQSDGGICIRDNASETAIKHAPEPGRIDKWVAFSVLLKVLGIGSLASLLSSDPALVRKLEDFRHQMVREGYSQRTQNLYSGDQLLRTLSWLEIDALFPKDLNFPISTMIAGLVFHSIAHPNDPLAQEVVLLEKLVNLRSIKFGFDIVVDPSNPSIHLIKEGVNNVRVFYASGIHATLDPPPHERENYNFSLPTAP